MIFHTTYKKPVLLVGSGVRSAGASKQLYKLIEKYKIPCLTTMNAVDLVQDKYKIGFIGTYGNRVANMILSECDLIISIGARLGLRQIGNKKCLFAPKAHLIRCDCDQYELARQIKDDEEDFHLDANYFITMLLNENAGNYSDWFDKCLLVKKILDDYDDTDGNRLMKCINDLLPYDPIISVDVGQHQCWAAQSLHLKGENGRIFISGGYGCMGCALPFAIGASISNNNSTIYCITGDGGLQMNIQELETVRRENLSIKILVVNNQVLGKISEIQHGSYNDRYAQTTRKSGYSVPDFAKVANAYGIKSKALNSFYEISNCKKWLDDNEPCLINIMINSDTLLIPKIKWDTNTIYPIIDDNIRTKIQSVLCD